MANSKECYAFAAESVNLISISLLFPTFCNTYSSTAYFIFLGVQFVFNLWVCRAFKRHRECLIAHGIDVHTVDILVLNNLLLLEQLSACNVRFCSVVLLIITYFRFFHPSCAGFSRMISCFGDDRKQCNQLFYILCASFFYTVFIAKQICLTKVKAIRGGCIPQSFGALVVSSALIYSIGSFEFLELE